MPIHFKHAMCNEAFDGRALAEQCRVMKAAGYEGIEIAPFTLAGDPLDIAASQRREYSDMIRSEGLEFVGLHWLLVGPRQVHVTTPDADFREASWLHVRNLIDLCADLAGNKPGENGVMIFGSPKQRSAIGGLTPAQATQNFTEGMASIAKHAESRGVTILVEALPKSQSDVICTLAEAAAVVDAIASPAIQTMFDTHNSEDETDPADVVIERYFGMIKHIHVNEMDGQLPGAGDYDFKTVFRVLDKLKYTGWVSLEAFNFELGADNIARESIGYLNRQIAEVFAQ